MIATYGLSHIQLTVRDLDRACRFYQGVLGMDVIRRIGTQAAMLKTPGSHEVFTLNARPESADTAGTMGGIAHFGFRVRDANAMASLDALIAACGGTVSQKGTRGNERYLFANDPDGYEVEFFAEEDER